MGRNDTVRRTRRDEGMIARNEIQLLTGNLEGRAPLEQDYPLVLLLVVEDRIRGVTAGDTLDTDVSAAEQLSEGFAAIRASRIGEDVSCRTKGREAQSSTTHACSCLRTRGTTSTFDGGFQNSRQRKTGAKAGFSIRPLP